MIYIMRQYPIINGFVQVPSNDDASRTKYIVGNQYNNPVGTIVDAQTLGNANVENAYTEAGEVNPHPTEPIKLVGDGSFLKFLKHVLPPTINGVSGVVTIP